MRRKEVSDVMRRKEVSDVMSHRKRHSRGVNEKKKVMS